MATDRNIFDVSMITQRKEPNQKGKQSNQENHS